MAKPQKKVSIELNIKSVRIKNLKESFRVLILWKRGSKSIDTKDVSIGPDKEEAVFNERF